VSDANKSEQSVNALGAIPKAGIAVVKAKNVQRSRRRAKELLKKMRNVGVE